jgi:hypothetical protein
MKKEPAVKDIISVKNLFLIKGLFYITTDGVKRIHTEKEAFEFYSWDDHPNSNAIRINLQKEMDETFVHSIRMIGGREKENRYLSHYTGFPDYELTAESIVALRKFLNRYFRKGLCKKG